MSIKETLSHQQQVPVTVATGRGRFGKLPADVLSRSDIGVYEKIVLLVMNMESYSSGFVALSDAAISQRSSISRTKVLDCRLRLEEAGLIRRSGPLVKQVQPYLLLHPQMAGKTPAAGATARQERSVTVPVTGRGLLKCARCPVRAPRLAKTGLCSNCTREAAVTRIVEKVLKQRAS